MLRSGGTRYRDDAQRKRGGGHLSQATSQQGTELRSGESPRRELLQLHLSIARAVLHASSESELVQSVCDKAVEVPGVRFACIGYAPAHASGPTVARKVACAGIGKAYLEELDRRGGVGALRDEPAVRTLSTARPTLEPDIERLSSTEGWGARARKHGLRAAVALPLHAGPVLGVLALYWDVPLALGPADLSLLAGLAADLGDGIAAHREARARHDSDAALRHSEALLAASQNLAHVGTFEITSFTEPTPWTAEMFAITGRDPAEGAPSPNEYLERYVVPEDRERVRARASAQLSRGGESELVYRLTRADGATRWIRSKTRAQLNAHGEVERLVGTLMDITDRKRWEDALRSSEAKYRRLHESMRDAFCAVDMQCRMTDVNDAYVNLVGYPREELIGRTFLDLTPEKWHAFEREIIDSQVLVRGFSDLFEKEYRQRDGTIIPVELRATVLRDEDGRPNGMWAIVRDIRERKAAEEALRQREEMMRYIVKHDPNALAVLDRKMRYIAVSDRFLQDYGVREAQVLGRGHYEVFPDMPERWREIHRRVLAGAVERNDDDSFERPDGSITYNRWECRPWYQADGAIGGMIMYTEVTTERKKMELALRDAARRKDEFLAMLGHELRNPLAPIRNANHVLKTIGSSDSRAQRAFGMIERQVTHLSRIVDDLLDVSRISRGKITLHPERVDWARLVRTTVEDFRSEIESRGIGLLVEVPETPQWLVGDPARLAQIVSNVLGNARKFTDAGGSIAVRLRAAAGDDGAGGGAGGGGGDGGGQTVLTVTDTGVGMTAETLNRIFEPFVQAEADMARSRGGLGLGLALVRGLVTLHGGSVQAASAGRNEGTTITISLPAAEAPAAEATTPESTDVGAAAGALTVLIIEDNADAAESLRMVLETCAARVETAADGAAGLARAQELRPDLVLCDIGLPGEMDGYAVARAMRGDPRLRGTRLVAMTGYGREEDRRRADAAGFDRHMTKPVDPQALETLVCQIAGRGRPAPGLIH